MRNGAIRIETSSILFKFMILMACTWLFSGVSDAHSVDIWVVEPFSSRPILPDTDMGAAHSDPAMTIVATPGEVESASFVIRSKKAIENFNVSTSDLRSDKDLISREHINVRVVKAWFQADGAWRHPRIRKRLKRVLVPELLLKDNDLVRVDPIERNNYLRISKKHKHEYVNVSQSAHLRDSVNHSVEALSVRDSEVLQPLHLQAGKNQQFFINISVPANTTPGEYVGELEFVNGDKPAGQRMIVALTVLPLNLVPSPLLYGVYYRGQLYPGQASVTSEIKTEAQLRTELQNIYAHGIKYPIVYQGNANPTSKAAIKKLRSDSLLDQYLRIRGEVGFPTDHLFYIGIGTDGVARNPVYAKRIIDIALKHSFENVYFYGRDEATGYQLRGQRKSWLSVRNVGGKVFAANNKHDIVQERMGDLIDVSIMARALRPEEAKALHRQGVKKVLSYNNPQSAVENPYPYRKNYGFALVGAGYDGAMIYAYQHAFGSIWNDFDHFRFRDHCLTYPTQDGVIDTLAWEAMREAVDDVRYLATLKMELARRAEMKNAAIDALRASAQTLYELIATDSDWKPSDIRKQIVSLVMALDAVQPVGE